MALSPVGASFLSRLPARRLVVVSVLLTALPLALLTSFSVHVASEGLETEVKTRLTSSAKLASAAIRNEMEGLSSVVASYASRPALVEALTANLSEGERRALVRRHLRELQASRPGIATAFLADPSGKLVEIAPATPSIVGDDFSFRDWYRGVTSTGRPYVSSAYISHAKGRPRVVAAAALVGPALQDGRPSEGGLAIIVAAYSLDTIQGFVDTFASSEGVRLAVTDQRGTLVAHAGQPLSGLVSRRGDPLVAAGLRGRSGVTTQEAGGDPLLSAYGPVEGLGWTITASIPEDEALAPVRKLRSTLLSLAAILGIVLSAGLALIVRVLRHLRRAVEAGDFLRAIVESSEDAIIGKGVDGTILSWNRGAELLYGYTAEEAVGQNIAILAPEERADEIPRILDRIKRGEQVLHFETVRLRKDGTRVNVSLTVSPIRNIAGAVVGASTIARDITERRRTETERDQFFSLSLDMVCVADFDGYFRQLNPIWETTLGWTLEELKAKPFIEFVHPDDREATMAEAGRLARGAKTISFENRYECKDGSFRWLLWSAAASVEQRLIYAVARDITHRKAAEAELRRAREEADRANRAKSEFLSKMSHELRTPLNAILGFGQLLEMDHLDEEQQESVHQILKGGKHLLTLIDEVLDIARIESGRMALSVEPVEVMDAVGEALDLIRPLAAERGIHMENEVKDDASLYVLADRQRLKQILLNLLSNAVKYNHEGGSVFIRCREVGGAAVHIDVTDQGNGIPENDIDRLFTPFDRLGANQTGVEGTGLGLALSRRLAEAMGGTLSVESTEGEGSTFSIRLSKTTSPEEDAMVVEWAEGGDPERQVTVLQIEDNPSNMRLVERILSRRPNSKLITAMQGSLGLDLARQHDPDLILLDLNLPDLSGHEVLRQLRDDTRLSEIPVVVVSADATKGQIQRVLAAGAQAYLTKPLDVQRFLEVVEEALHPPAEEEATKSASE